MAAQTTLIVNEATIVDFKATIDTFRTGKVFTFYETTLMSQYETRFVALITYTTS